MPARQTDRRPDVYNWANEGGWKRETKNFDSDKPMKIVRDVFTKGDLRLWAIWLSTPWSDAIWVRGLLERSGQQPLTVPDVTSSGKGHTLESVLKGTDPSVH